VTHAAAAELSFRQPTEADHARVLAVLEPWWGGFKGADGARERALLVPRLYFQHFTTTSCLAEHPDGTLAAFLIGFRSQAEPATAYIHFVGVDPALHGQGVGRSLYAWFFDRARAVGARRVKCVTSPANTASRAFHGRLGFAASPVLPDYDGPGLDRVAFTRSLAGDQG
jgi:GNAT superfamily N-acetyltransferase